VGTGIYKSFEETELALELSGKNVTVALRRVDSMQTIIVKPLDLKNLQYCQYGGCTMRRRVRVCRLGCEISNLNLVKLEVWGIPILLPKSGRTLKALKILVQDGFTVMKFTATSSDCQTTGGEEGSTVVMPAGAHGSGQGILNPNISLYPGTSESTHYCGGGCGTDSMSARL
jgi:thiazole synthase